MSTSALLSRLTPRVSSGWSMSTGNRSILSLVQQGIDELFRRVLSNRIYIGSDNEGYPPYLKTTAGTYDYSVVAANLSAASLIYTMNGVDYPVLADQVLRVMVDATENDYDQTRKWIGAPFSYRLANPYTTASTRIYMAEIPVHSTPGLETTPPMVKFLDDPGTTETKYFVEFTWRMPRLTSTSIPLPIPIEFERALEDFVIGSVQESETGAPSQLMQRFEMHWIPEFRRHINRGANPRNRTRTLRMC